MFLHKYKDESGTFYGLTGSNNSNNVKLLAKSVGKNVIPADRVKNALALIEAAFREEPEEKEPEKKEPEKKELEKEKPEKKESEKKVKTAVSDIIRKYAQMLSSADKE